MNTASTATLVPTPDVDDTQIPVTFFYDLPCFIGDGFAHGAADVDFWDRAQQQEVADERARDSADASHHHGSLLTDINFQYRSLSLTLAEDRAMDQVLRDVLYATTSQVHALAADQRGAYLAQMLTRWFSTGTLGWFRFRLGHLLANYYEALPTSACSPVGPVHCITTAGDEMTLYAWETSDGVVLDLLHPTRPHQERLDVDVDAAFTAGEQAWPDTFKSLRWVPLDDPTAMRVYFHAARIAPRDDSTVTVDHPAAVDSLTFGQAVGL